MGRMKSLSLSLQAGYALEDDEKRYMEATAPARLKIHEAKQGCHRCPGNGNYCEPCRVKIVALYKKSRGV